MKIALISLSNHYTFQETIHNLKKYIELNTKTYKVTLITNESSYFQTKYSDSIYVSYPSKIKEIFKPKYIKEYIELKQNIIQKKFDIVIFINPHPWNIFLTKSLNKVCRVINIIHDVTPHAGDKNTRLVNIYNKLISNKSKEIILHSEHAYRDFARFKSKSRIHVTSLWRDFREYQNPVFNKTILLFGRINYYKGIGYLDEISRILNDIRINIVGKIDIGLSDKLDYLKSRSNVMIDDSVIDTKKMEYYFTNCELVILPYVTATQSGVIIDSYSFSRPIVVFDVGGLSEQLINGESGYIVENGDVKTFCKRIREYLNLSQSEKEKITHKSWEFGYKKYSTQLGYKRLLDIVNNNSEVQQ